MINHIFYPENAIAIVLIDNAVQNYATSRDIDNILMVLL